jgi:hypothetical protein
MYAATAKMHDAKTILSAPRRREIRPDSQAPISPPATPPA